MTFPTKATKITTQIRKIRLFADKFKYAGQNIARRGNTRDYEDSKDAIEHMVMDWFNEYADANMSYINAFRVHDDG